MIQSWHRPPPVQSLVENSCCAHHRIVQSLWLGGAPFESIRQALRSTIECRDHFFLCRVHQCPEFKMASKKVRGRLASLYINGTVAEIEAVLRVERTAEQTPPGDGKADSQYNSALIQA